MLHKKVSVRELYFQEQEKYTKIYGDRTIVFFQIGTFYEAYCNKTQGYSDLVRLEALLGMKYNKRDDMKCKKGHARDNNFGIPCVSIQRNLTTLIEAGYIIVLFDQTSRDEDSLERICTGVFSKGTFLSDRQVTDANYMMSVYISEEPQLKNKQPLMAVGVTLIDVTTGSNMVHEFYSNKFDGLINILLLPFFKLLKMISSTLISKL